MEVPKIKRGQKQEYWQENGRVIDGGKRIQWGGRRFDIGIMIGNEKNNSSGGTGDIGTRIGIGNLVVEERRS
jgi:hypothetical protein